MIARCLFLLSFFLSTASFAQCDGCVPDLSCTADPAFPTLCPETAPPATVGQYYEEDFTFWMPPTFTDPGSGFDVTLLQLTVTGVSGMPFGLQFTASSPTGVYYPQDDAFGCARICGTPFGAGDYTVTISVVATVSASGFTLDVPTSFPVSISVLPGSGGNASFTYSPTTGCGSVTASFQASIDGSPSPTSYAWSFGNGAVSNAATPPAQTFQPAGSYPISLQTTIGGYVLQAVNLASVNGNWCGDVEEPNLPIIGCTGSPDPYFVLTNAGGGTYTSSAFTDVASGSWATLGQLLDNPPYSISFYDEDVISGDDLLGTYNLTITGAGTYFFNVAGGTTGSLVITNEPQQVFIDTAYVTVFPLPDVSVIQNTTTTEICAVDQGLASYAWLLDGQPVPDEMGACVVPSGPGLWQLVGANGFGCSDTSAAIVVCPVFNIAQNGNVLFVPSGYSSYSWTYNGTAIGGNSAFVFLQGDGTYSVTVDAGNGCTINLSFLWDTTGVGEALSDRIGRLAIFPAPTAGPFTVAAEGLSSSIVRLELLDAGGRILHEWVARPTQGRLIEAVTIDLARGSYLLRLYDGDRAHTGRVIRQ
jgi:PKD repeat protein